MTSRLRLGALALWLLPALTARAGITVVDRPDTTKARNHHYVSNRPPLLPSPFVKLPVKSIRPEGWLRRQLQLQAAGFHGHLGELSDFLKKENNAWLNPGGQGQHGWEELPYWLKGFGDCASLVGDEAQNAEAKLWIEAILRSQRDDGFFGPRGPGGAATVESTKGKYDLWPNMLALDALRSYHEATGDDRVIPFMTRYFRFELAIPEADFLPPFWQQQRAADNLACVYWLYNRTGAPWLLELAAKIHRHTADWTGGIASWHNVNMMQAFGGPTIYWMQSHDPKHLDASERNYQTIRTMYGQVPGGLFGGDENCRPGYTDPHQCVETCGMVEFMNTAEKLVAATGNPIWADRCEDVAFNSLPAALTADLKALRYLTGPNQVVSDRRSHSPGVQNGGPMFLMNPYDHRCCQHNVGMGWPYLAEHLWMATPDDGLALMFPLESTVKAKVAGGIPVALTTTTHYPFDPNIEVRFSTAQPVTFPLYLRIPGWCARPVVAVNHHVEAVAGVKPLSYLRIERPWKDEDTVTLTLPMEVRLRTWAKNHDSVSVDRGPLTYSLLIGEQHVRAGGTDRWPAWEIRPTTPWNYGLVLDARGPARSFQVVRRDWPKNDTPFTTDAVPVRLRARARKIPQWQLDRYGLAAALQDSPVASDEPVETVTLVPMGAARLRIASFPVIGAAPAAHPWVDTVPGTAPSEVSASHCFDGDTIDAADDGLVPVNSDDHAIPRFTWWPRQGTSEWIGLDFPKSRTVSQVEVYWFDDSGHGGCRVPRSWRVVYRDGQEWKPVASAKLDPVAKDRFNVVTFDPVETKAVRVEVELQPGMSGGVLEMRVR
jgi:hypothetical protein